MAKLNESSQTKNDLDKSDISIDLKDKHDYEIFARLYFGSH